MVSVLFSQTTQVVHQDTRAVVATAVDYLSKPEAVGFCGFCSSRLFLI